MSLARFPYAEGEARVRTCDVPGCDRHGEYAVVKSCNDCTLDVCDEHAKDCGDAWTCTDCVTDRARFEFYAENVAGLDVRRVIEHPERYFDKRTQAAWQAWVARGGAVTS